MLEGATLAPFVDAMLTLRCSLPAHRSLLADGTTLYVLGEVDDFDGVEGPLPDQFLPAVVRLCVQRAAQQQLLAGRGSGGSCVLPSYAPALSRATAAPAACGRAQGYD